MCGHCRVPFRAGAGTRGPIKVVAERARFELANGVRPLRHFQCRALDPTRRPLRSESILSALAPLVMRGWSDFRRLPKYGPADAKPDQAKHADYDQRKTQMDADPRHAQKDPQERDAAAAAEAEIHQAPHRDYLTWAGFVPGGDRRPPAAGCAA